MTVILFVEPGDDGPRCSAYEEKQTLARQRRLPEGVRPRLARKGQDPLW